MKNHWIAVLPLLGLLGYAPASHADSVLKKKTAKIFNQTGLCMCVKVFSGQALSDGRKACTSVVGESATSATGGLDPINRIHFYLYPVKTCAERGSVRPIVTKLVHPKKVGAGGQFTFKLSAHQKATGEYWLNDLETTKGAHFMETF